MEIFENYLRIREQVPPGVVIVAAAKRRTPGEILDAVRAGVKDVGENYVQEAEKAREGMGEEAKRVRWHMIGHLQNNKINRALRIFDVIQTIDSYEKAASVDERVEKAGRSVVPVFIEVNIGSEESKSGIRPENHDNFGEFMSGLVRDVSSLEHLRPEGIMTMGPRSGNPEDMRPYFRRTRELFERARGLGLPGADMRHLSMGMSNSYRVAADEGSTMVRIGTAIFGRRE